MPMRPLALARAAVVVALVSASVGAYAMLESEAIIKYRQGVMKAIGGHMAASAQVVRGKVDQAEALEAHAAAIAALSKNVPELFPEGSDFGETDAKIAIWDDWSGFEEAARKSSEAAQAYQEAAGSGDRAAVAAAFKDLSDTCKGCHEDYRVKD